MVTPLICHIPTTWSAEPCLPSPEKKLTAGKDPQGMAAAAIYIACVIEGEKKTQKEIAEAAGVTEVTVRNRYKGLRRSFNLEF